MEPISKRTVLYVDDEVENRTVFEAALEDRFRVLTAATADEALDVIAREAVPVVVSDQRMPGKTGVDLFDVLRVRYPQTRRILLTAYTEPSAMIDAINRGQIYYFLKKPWERASIESVIVRAIEAHDVAIALERQSAVLVQQNDELRSMQQQLEQASRLKSEFLTNMSHEIRTPMTAILGFAELLRDRLGKAEDLETADTIRRNGEYLLAILDDILDFSRIEAGALKIDLGPCSPRTIVNDVVSLTRPRCEAKGLWLDVVVDDTVPRAVRSDAVRLRQILLNLLGNAVKFTDGGGVRLGVRLVPGDDGERLEFDVADTGIGIAAERLHSLFQPFSQGDSSMSRRFGGTGLGLAISRRLAQLLGGEIAVQSVPGQGSVFSLTVASGTYQNLLTGKAADAPLNGLPEADRPELRARILVAEDNYDSQRLLKALLEAAGAEVTVVDNGQQAVEQALATPEPYAIILMDMYMPVLDGYRATRQLRERGYAGQVVAITAHAMAGARQECLDAGCDEVITKPFDRHRLLSRLGELAAKSLLAV